jgi:hypothetical protein
MHRGRAATPWLTPTPELASVTKPPAPPAKPPASIRMTLTFFTTTLAGMPCRGAAASLNRPPELVTTRLPECPTSGSPQR